MSDYQFPYKDAAFVLEELLDFDQLCQAAGIGDVNTELAHAILEEAARMGSEVIAPLNTIGDRQAATLEDDGVHETPGFAEAYRQYAEDGWASLSAPQDWGGQGMPRALAAAVVEIWDSACVAFSLCPLLTSGGVEALAVHGTGELKQRYLPKLVSGEWTATMNLTEPAAGSDLAAVATRAVPEGDHYLISGQKIFITWGDHRMTDNIIHLVLARLPDAPAGVKGISMFLVPKFVPDENGEPGERNDVVCVGLEHKLGIHASPTCTMSFGDNGGAVGYLVGEPHRGLAAMFTMMNDARQGVGLQSLGVSERAYQQAAAYAKERLQGTRSDGSRFPIIEFPDVRRMLMTMKAATETMRALLYTAAAEVDWIHAAETAADKSRHIVRTGIYTPIVKGWISELAQEITSLGIQVHGGMGFVEETGAAQHYRDARIMSIYEGTTGIQAMDLVKRKTLADGGAGLGELLDEIQASVADLEAADGLGAMASRLQTAVEAARTARTWLLENAKSDPHAAGAGSYNFLMLMGYVCGGWLMGRAAVKAARLKTSAAGDSAFAEAKLVTARFYFDHLLPRADACLSVLESGSASTMALDVEQF